MKDTAAEVVGGCIGIIYTLSYRIVIVLAAIKYLRS